MADVSLDLRYADWRATEDGERVVQYVAQRALAMRQRGWRHYGIAALVEVARYDRALEVGPDHDGLKINNSYRAFIAREVMQDPRIEGFFEIRRSVADAPESLPPGTQPADFGMPGTADDKAWRESVGGGRPMPESVRMDTSGMPAEAASIARHIEDRVWGNIRTIPPVTPADVPVATRWRCTQPECGQEVTMESAPHIQPGLGGYKQGQCPNRTCWTNKRTGKERGHSFFAPIKRGAHL